jgi:hypothetical protein
MFMSTVTALTDTRAKDITGKVVPMPAGSKHIISNTDLPYFMSKPDAFLVDIGKSILTGNVDANGNIADLPAIKIEDFYVVADGTDSLPALNRAMAYLDAGHGGIIDFPNAYYRFNGVIRPPYLDDPSYPNMKPLTFRGQGSHWNTGEQAAAAINGGTTFDIRGGTAYGKVQLRGLGVFTSTGITYTNLGTADTYPIIYTTNTTLKLKGNAFIGHSSLSGIACNQDAIVMGGTVATIGNAETSAFQGYGTIIEGNYYNHIQRAVYGRTYCNSTIVRDNTIWLQCGSNLGGGAAIEFDGDPALINFAVGNSLLNNLIEMFNYTYAIRMKVCSNSFISGNSGWDGSPQNLAVVYLENSSYQNTVLGAEGVPGKPYFLEGNPGANGNTYIGCDTSAKNGQTFAGQQGTTVFTGPAAPWATTVAALNAWTNTPLRGQAFATNGRKSAEAAGLGTGCPVWWDGTNWLTFYGNAAVTA